jgi:uncharacterized protein YbjQ (UPF0145 family)
LDRFFKNLKDQLAGLAPQQPSPEEQLRDQQWAEALSRGALPQFVHQRLADTAAGKVPWISTLRPAELALARSQGIHPLGLVSGTCWFHFGYSWTHGHREGWDLTLSRLAQEARSLGANAVVDVTLKTSRNLGQVDSMDFMAVGTAVRVDGLAPAEEVPIASVPALEFVRLLDLGVLPVGLAVGASYEWLTDWSGRAAGQMTWWNQEAGQLSHFARSVQLRAIEGMRQDAARQGNGVLGSTQFSELLCFEGGEDNPNRYLARHIAVGTAILDGSRTARPSPVGSLGVRPVLDLEDTSPLQRDALQQEPL